MCVCVSEQLEERARKAVEQATSISAVLKLYNKWLEKSQSDGAEGEEVTGKKGGLLKTLKSTIAKPSKEATVREQMTLPLCVCVCV